MIKAVVTSIVDDWIECDTMERFERDWGTERFARIMKGIDEYFVGTIVSWDTPLGYVENNTSLFFEHTSHREFSEYARSEGI